MDIIKRIVEKVGGWLYGALILGLGMAILLGLIFGEWRYLFIILIAVGFALAVARAAGNEFSWFSTISPFDLFINDPEAREKGKRIEQDQNPFNPFKRY